MTEPLAVDLCCGLGGWTEGLLAEGWQVRGYDIEAHEYGEERYPGELVLRDVLEMHGSEIADAELIVASPPCTEYSYMAMPWSRAKQIGRALRGEDEFPDPYKGSRTIAELNAIFDTCFRIQREASEAAGRHIPMIVENVKGAQPWVGRAQWSFGSFFLWGDIPALMPMTLRLSKMKGRSLSKEAPPEAKWGGHNVSPSHEDAIEYGHGTKNAGGSWFNVAHNTTSGCGQNPDGRRQPGLSGTRDNGKGDRWVQDGAAKHGSKSPARKAASAMIAKIPLALSSHIARVYKPKRIAA